MTLSEMLQRADHYQTERILLLARAWHELKLEIEHGPQVWERYLDGPRSSLNPEQIKEKINE